MESEEAQSKIFEFENLRERVESLARTKEIIQSEIDEIEQTKETFEEIKKLEEGNRIFFPLGSGSYGIGEIENTDEVLVNVGSNAIIKEKISKATDILEAKEEEFRSQTSRLDDTLNKAYKRLQKLQTEIQKMAR